MRSKITIFFLACFVTAFSQSTSVRTVFMDNLKKADLYFNKSAYRNALNIYLRANEQNPTSIYIQEQIADCYFYLNNPTEAEIWYRKIINEVKLHPDTKFKFAEVLSLLGKYAESKYWFEADLKDHPEKRITSDKAIFLDKIDYYLLDSLAFIVKPVGFNSPHADFGPAYFHEGIAFASSRDQELFLKNKPANGFNEEESLLNMYYVPHSKNTEASEVQLMHRNHLGSSLHEGPMAFYDHGKKTAFTRTNLARGRAVYGENGKAHLQIYFAEIDKLNSMRNIRPFEFNSANYSVAHPTFSKDGNTMYFTSTAPKGLGGSDIYRTEFKNGAWTEPENLGSNVNSEADESFPFLANDTALYFASNGHGSMGGLDILVCYKSGNQFSRPINFGSPLNSMFDDFSFIADSTGRAGYFASNRAGGQGLDDIYQFSLTNFFFKGKVKFLDSVNQIISDVKLVAKNKASGQIADSTRSDSKGLFALKLPFNQDFEINISKPGYQLNENLFVSTRGLTMGIDSINVLLKKQDLVTSGKIYSNETQQVLEGVTIKVINVTENKTDVFAPQTSDSYHLNLKRNRSFMIEFSKPGYKTKTISIITSDMYSKEYMKDILMEEEAIETVLIQFDYKKGILSKAAIEKLGPVIKLLNDKPESKLLIIAHADSRGEQNANLKLSQARAKSITDYLIKSGIDSKRLTAQAFGETLLLNDCFDNKPCKEEDHAANRIAELKVQY
jgi:outer membrane protein OmpA-like peptidoglycan-associated protein